MKPTKPRSRWAIVLIFVIFFAPIVTAYWLNITKPDWITVGDTKGMLIEPPVLMLPFGLSAIGKDKPAPTLRDFWTVALVVGDTCGELCLEKLVELRNMRLSLGNDAFRINRLLLVNTPGAASLAAQLSDLAKVHPDLSLASVTNTWMATLPALEASTTGLRIIIIDPQGYAMLQFPDSTSIKDITRDLKRMLKISKIG